MLGRFLGLGLDIKLAAKADLLFIIDPPCEEASQMLEFSFFIRVPQR